MKATSVADAFLLASLSVGTLAAAAALYGRYRVLPSFFTGPEICRREAAGCQVLFRTPEASLLGVPNAALGLLLYGLIVLGLAAGWPTAVLLAGASVSLAMTLFLARYLLTNRLECRICWLGHVANLVLWAALLARLVAARPSGASP